MKRFDHQKFDNYEVMPQGFLRIPVYAARTGIQVYRRGDGKIIREYRPPEEVFSEKTMASTRCCPFVNNHPSEMVNLDNAKALVGGMTVDHVEKLENKYLKTYLIVYDKDMIEDIKRGKREVSMGYDVELDFTPGEIDGEKYDAIQRNIIHNHIALVDRARGGKEIKLRLDSQSAELVTEQDTQGGDLKMAKIKMGDKEFEVAQEIADAFCAYEQEMNAKAKKGDELEPKVKDAETKLTSMTKERDTLQGKVDSLEAEKKEKNKDSEKEPKIDAAIEAGVKERLSVLKVAEKVLSAEEAKKLDGMSNSEIKKTVIKKEFKDTVLDGKSDAYIDARFDHISESLEVSGKANDAAGKAIAKNRQDAKKDERKAEEAREKSMKEDQERWKQTPGKKGE